MTQEQFKTYTLDEAEEQLDELLPDNVLWEDYETHQIWLDGPCIRIPELNVDIYPGVYCQFDEEENEFVPDFSIYVFMELGTKEYVYDEGYTSLGAAIHNYANRIGVTCDVYSLECELPNQFN